MHYEQGSNFTLDCRPEASEFSIGASKLMTRPCINCDVKLNANAHKKSHDDTLTIFSCNVF